MTIPRLTEMTAYWRDNPPMHEMIASYFSVGKFADKKADAQETGSIEELLQGVPMVNHEAPK